MEGFQQAAQGVGLQETNAPVREANPTSSFLQGLSNTLTAATKPASSGPTAEQVAAADDLAVDSLKLQASSLAEAARESGEIDAAGVSIISKGGSEALDYLNRVGAHGLNNPTKTRLIAVTKLTDTIQRVGNADYVSKNANISLSANTLSPTAEAERVRKELADTHKSVTEMALKAGMALPGTDQQADIEAWFSSPHYQLELQMNKNTRLADLHESDKKAAAKGADGVVAGITVSHGVEQAAMLKQIFKSANGDAGSIDPVDAVSRLRQAEAQKIQEVREALVYHPEKAKAAIEQINRDTDANIEIVNGRILDTRLSSDSKQLRLDIDYAYAEARAKANTESAQIGVGIKKYEYKNLMLDDRFALGERIEKEAEMLDTLKKLIETSDTPRSKQLAQAALDGFGTPEQSVDMYLALARNPKVGLEALLSPDEYGENNPYNKAVAIMTAAKEGLVDKSVLLELPAVLQGLKDSGDFTSIDKTMEALRATMGVEDFVKFYSESGAINELVPEIGENLRLEFEADLGTLNSQLANMKAAGGGGATGAIFGDSGGLVQLGALAGIDYAYADKTGDIRLVPAQGLAAKGLNASQITEVKEKLLSFNRQIAGKYSSTVNGLATLDGLSPSQALSNLVASNARFRDIEVPQFSEEDKDTFNQLIEAGDDKVKALLSKLGFEDRVNRGREIQAGNLKAAQDAEADLRNTFGLEQQPEGEKVQPPAGKVSSVTVPQPELETLAVKGGFSEKEAKIMAAIAMAESSGKSDALNDNLETGDDSYGLWQINMIDKPDYKLGEERRGKLGLSDNSELYDPLVNVRAARLIFEEQGFNAWSVYKSGAYKRFLKG